jgi:hypothetical protein
LAGVVRAQESAGQATIGLQQYYWTFGQQPVANILGLTLNYDQFIPNVGLLSASFVPALSSDRFRTGEDYLRLKGLPWEGQYWTFSAGDFHVPGQLLAVPFSNVFIPDIAGRGGWIEATHGGRTFGFFYGTGTISNTPKVVLRLSTPQTLSGFYFRQQIGDRLLLGVRVMRFANDLTALQKMSNILPQTNIKSATTASLDALYTLAGPLKLYGEATWSMARLDGPQFATRDVPVSFLAGPSYDTQPLTIRANYVFQNASYFPVLGTYLGDRAGPFGEVTYRPSKRLEIFGSVSEYRNNIAEDPTLPTFRSATASAGASVQLPGSISLNTQILFLDLSTQANRASDWSKSKNQQELAMLNRTFGRHNLQFTGREYRQLSTHGSQRETSGEIADNFHIRRLTLSAGVRLQRQLAGDSRTSLFYRGAAQFTIRRFSVYGNFETGNDLQNKTLFALNTVSTTSLGASMTMGKNWEFQCEAYRNNLITTLNPQSIFVLQGQGVFIPGTLAALNQWSMYSRISRNFHWGKGGTMGDLRRSTLVIAPLMGSLDGFVMERLTEGNRPAEGVSVSLDRNRTVVTDAEGRFHFPEVPEGSHNVALALRELPADFDPGAVKETTVAVYPSKLARGDLDVIRLAFIQGKVTGPPDVPVEDIVIRIEATGRYTTPDSEGNFYFYNLREGDYNLMLDEKSLPEYGVTAKPDHVSVAVRLGQQPQPIGFRFEVHKPAKPVRNVLERTAEAQPLQREPKPPVDVAVEPLPPRPSSAPKVRTPLPVRATPLPPAAVKDRTPAGPNQSPAVPADAPKHNLIGRQLTQAGDYRGAIAEFNAALRIAPGFALAYNARGYAWFLLHNYAAALDDLNEAIRLNPKYANAYQIRGLAKKAAGDLSAAVADLRLAKELAR